MRNHEWARREYKQLKQELAMKHPFDRVSYTNGKSPYVEKIISLANSKLDEST
ncbi:MULTISPECIES: GrpB family protein [Bacillus cereus group]|uniref:GrpB family protein n=1 Tax=Bacillus cereus group TaxID=86661 RepID=UPI002355E9AE|nr:MULTISPECIES: GrpB family protein [Bacillus cereus group]